MRTNIAVGFASFALSLLVLTDPGTSRADTLFVSTFGNGLDGTIEEFNSSGVGTVFASNITTRCLAVDSDGNVYADIGAAAIVKYNSSGIGTTFVSGSSGLVDPFAMTLDNSGNLYVANYVLPVPVGGVVGDNVAEFNSSGVGGVLYNNVPQPTGIAWDGYGDPNGNLFVSSQNSNLILEYESTSQGGDFSTSGLSGPFGIAFDTSGDMYVANYNNGTIEKFNSSGGVVTNVGTLFASGLNGPIGLACDSKDNLFVANFNGDTIEEFNSSGVGTIFASGLDLPYALAIEDIPEPSTWAMVAMGIGGVLGGLRLRRAI